MSDRADPYNEDSTENRASNLSTRQNNKLGNEMRVKRTTLPANFFAMLVNELRHLRRHQRFAASLLVVIPPLAYCEFQANSARKTCTENEANRGNETPKLAPEIMFQRLTQRPTKTRGNFRLHARPISSVRTRARIVCHRLPYKLLQKTANQALEPPSRRLINPPGGKTLPYLPTSTTTTHQQL